MNNFVPPRPGGTSPESRFMQWVWDSIRSMRISDVSGVRIERGPMGTSIVSRLDANGAISSRPYRVKSVQSDYITCRTWDGTTEGNTDVLLAKPARLRNSITFEVKFGVTHTYAYTTGADSLNIKRQDSDGSRTENQRVIPIWLENEIVYGMPCNTLVNDVSSNPISLIVSSDSRQWMAY